MTPVSVIRSQKMTKDKSKSEELGVDQERSTARTTDPVPENLPLYDAAARGMGFADWATLRRVSRTPEVTAAVAHHGDAGPEHYGRLSHNVESCINTLVMFVEDRWPEHYREGALRSLRREIREEIRLAVARELVVDPSRSTPKTNPDDA